MPEREECEGARMLMKAGIAMAVSTRYERALWCGREVEPEVERGNGERRSTPGRNGSG